MKQLSAFILLAVFSLSGFADIDSDVAEGKSITKKVEDAYIDNTVATAIANAQAAGMPAGEIVVKLIGAGIEPVKAVTSVVRAEPSQAPTIAAAAAAAMPEAAPEITAAAINALP